MTNHPNRKLTPSLRDMLAQVSRATDGGGALLQLTISANGNMAKARKLLEYGLIQTCQHPSIVSDSKGAPSVRITDAGRAALNLT